MRVEFNALIVLRETDGTEKEPELCVIYKR